jgi:hypothetical protein
MSRRLAAMQPHFLPWFGFFELMRLSDVFVHLDDLALPQGRSYMSRVRISIQDSEKWITAPIASETRRQLISKVQFEDSPWRESHLRSWSEAYRNSPFYRTQSRLTDTIYANQTTNLADFNINAIEITADHLGLNRPSLRSSALQVRSHSSARLVDICRIAGADEYITGHGAFGYLDHSLFEDNGIKVSYVAYRWVGRPDSNAVRFPFHSCIAHIGYEEQFKSASYGRSELIAWRDFDPLEHGFRATVEDWQES